MLKWFFTGPVKKLQKQNLRVMKNRKMYLYRINSKAGHVLNAASGKSMRLQKPLKLLFYTIRKPRMA
jgi:hypothetical protein